MLVKLEPTERMRVHPVDEAENPKSPWYNGSAIYLADSLNENGVLVVAYSTSLDDDEELYTYFEELNTTTPAIPVNSWINIIPYTMISGKGATERIGSELRFKACSDKNIFKWMRQYLCNCYRN